MTTYFLKKGNQRFQVYFKWKINFGKKKLFSSKLLEEQQLGKN
jgi:hypothetical protein